jgi:catechol 2,3-dioxygenase-like lactoylglutathione lyase family enzyme
VSGGARLDHVALGVSDLDERLRFLADTLGFTLRRLGTNVRTGGRIAMLGHPDTPVKIELIESPDEQGFLHLAVQVDDVAAEFARLTAAGLTPVRPPFRLEAAKADSAVLRDPAGWTIQIVHYDPDSPDR